MQISLRCGGLSEPGPRGIQNHPAHWQWQTRQRIDSNGYNARKAIHDLVCMFSRHLISPDSFSRLHSAWKTPGPPSLKRPRQVEVP